jgi:hypothetical protein
MPEAKIYTSLVCTLKDFVILPFQTLTAIRKKVKIVGILDFAVDTSWNFKNM